MNDATADKKLIFQLKSELAWHSSREEGTSGPKFNAPVVEQEDGKEEVEELVGGGDEDVNVQGVRRKEGHICLFLFLSSRD